jgi:hypothetical protein
MRITSAGDVGIGTSSPAVKLDVAGAMNVSGNVNIGGGANVTMFNYIDTVYMGSTSGASLTGQGIYTRNDAIKRVHLIVNSADVAVLTTTGLAVTGLLDISAATSGQIKFPTTQNASSNANTLDDYEEGTWTGTLTPLTSGSITLSVATCSYTKIGRSVTVNGQLNTTAASTPLGRLRVGGLPFTSASGTQFESVATIRVVGGNAIIAIDALIPNAASFIDIYPAGTTTDTYASNINSSSGVIFSATYFV